jgi:hypothetical protein
MTDPADSPAPVPPEAQALKNAQALTTAAKGSANKKVQAGASSENGGNDVSDEVTNLLAVNPPTWPWALFAFAILAAGTLASYELWRLVKPTDFVPSANYATYAGLFIMALAIERILEPFSGLFIPTTKVKKATSRATAAQAKRDQAAAIGSGPYVAAAAPADLARKPTVDQDRKAAVDQARRAAAAAAVAQTELHRSQGSRAVLMWAAASVLAMLACASLGIFLLRSVETPSPANGSTASASASSRSAASSVPSPANDPNRLLDLLVTGLVVGAGTKPLHDLISQVQTSSDSSKAKASSTTTAG